MHGPSLLCCPSPRILATTRVSYEPSTGSFQSISFSGEKLMD
ncbi:MAG TPA: hypothetical protein VGL22_00820 [Terracidiphilus sp.]